MLLYNNYHKTTRRSSSVKKIISFMLVIVLVLGLCACGGSGTKAAAGLEVGYAKEKIMPTQPTPLGGYGASSFRLHESFLDYLYVTCIAFRWGEDVVLWYTQDSLNSVWFEEARFAITSKTGVPGERIMICATHTHSAPDQRSTEPVIGAYKTIYTEAMAKAAATAIADLAPGKLYGASTTANLNFIRHYKLSDGTVAGDNFGNFTGNTIVDHAAKNDPEMLLLKVDREGDKKDILVMNWQAHPCTTGGRDANGQLKTDISADFIAGVRDAFEAQGDYLFAYFTGAAGNHNTTSRITGESEDLNKDQLGQKLYQIAMDAIPNMQPIEGEGIKLSHEDFLANVNHDDEHLIVQARTVVSEYNKTGDNIIGNKLARENGMASIHHASAITARIGRPQQATMEINAANIAGFTFITAPFEMFAATGMYIKENSPNEYTFICAISNGTWMYVPTAEAYEYGCYESQISYFAKGTAEALQTRYIDMLESIK